MAAQPYSTIASTSAHTSSSIQNKISQYCMVSRDEMLMADKCREQAQQFQTDLAQCKTVLAEYLNHQRKSCIPIPLQIDGEDRTFYLRLSEKTTYKTVNEDAFKRVIETVPSAHDLQTVFDQMEDPNASLVDVYATWIFNCLYEQNAIKRTVFEVTDKKERSKKTKGPTEPSSLTVHVPDNIVQATETWVNIQHNLKRLKQFKQSNLARFTQEKKAVEPDIDSFLSSRPPDKQEQKISMTMNGETKPFYLKRIVEKKKPALTLAKSKPLILKTVKHALEQCDSRLPQTPFSLPDADNVLHNELLLSLLFSEFRTQLTTYKTKGVKVNTRVELKEKRESASKRKRTNEDGDDDDNDDDDADNDYN